MEIQARYVLLLLCLVVAACASQHKIPIGKSTVFSVDTMVAPFIASPLTKGLSIATFQNGTTQFFNYGKISDADQEAPTENTIYEIGSITKTFTATVLAQMVAEGKVSLADPISKYLPKDLVSWPADNPITLLDLATHKSGLPRIPENMTASYFKNIQNPYLHYSVEELYEFLKKYKPIPIASRKVSYSNLGMGLLGHILTLIEQEKTFEDLVRKRIFAPLKMSNSFIEDKEGRLIQGHDDKGKVTSQWDLPTLAGAGAIRSNTADMVRYGVAQMHEDLYSKGAHEPREDYDDKQKIGLAWMLTHDPVGDFEIVWHTGGTGGFRSFLGFSKEKEILVVILNNSTQSVDFLGVEILRGLAK
jgi:CubicO group peptidase (beta-lactamase class C family)